MSRDEVAGLLAVIDRDIEASGGHDLNEDWQFAIAYNAALQCAALALKAAGYDVPKGGGAHHRTIDSLKFTLGDAGNHVDLLQRFRAKRAGGIYETTGIATATEIREMRALAKTLQAKLIEWLKTNHRQLMPHPAAGQAGAGSRKKR